MEAYTGDPVVFDDPHLVRTLDRIREHNPVVVTCTRNAIASSGIDQIVKQVGRSGSSVAYRQKIPRVVS